MNILIAEDNAPSLNLLGDLLQAEGHRVFPATDGVQAWELLQREQIEAIISDILMPRMDGYQLCEHVRHDRRLHKVVFIFYTGSYTSETDERLALKFGADKYLRKPACYEQIRAALQEALRRDATDGQADGVDSVPPYQNGHIERCRHQPVIKEYSEALVAKVDQK